MAREYREIAAMMKERRGRLKGKTVTVGFDGFIDEIIRVVKTRSNESQYTVYNTIHDFSQRIAAASGMSGDIEIVTQGIKFGGNAPIMADALSTAGAGVCVNCIGAMGYPELHAAFSSLDQKCNLFSVGNPGITNALEFDDGKIMLANMAPLEKVTWDHIKQLLAPGVIKEFFIKSDMIALVNWSNAYHMNTIWKGIHDEILPLLPPDDSVKKTIFFDLADPSKRSADDITAVLDLIGSYGGKFEVILGLNENEARWIARILAGDGNINNKLSLEDIGKYVYTNIDVDVLLVHPQNRCICYTDGDIVTRYGKVIEKPVITTGGGDNFNAGYCLGRLLGLDNNDSIVIGMAVSSFYVKYGKSPLWEELALYLDE